MTAEISIFIVDDHEILRDGIRAMLLGTNIKVLGDFSGPDVLLERLKQQQPDVILLDIVMPRMSGIELLEILQHKYPSINILMLSAETEEQKIQQAIKLGALGFLPKDCGKEELLNGIRTIANGQNYFGTSILSTIFKGYIASSKGKGQIPLSEREISIVALLCEGMSYKQVAAKLFISPRTVENHKQTIFKKLQLENNAQLIKYAIKHGITSLE